MALNCVVAAGAVVAGMVASALLAVFKTGPNESMLVKPLKALQATSTIPTRTTATIIRREIETEVVTKTVRHYITTPAPAKQVARELITEFPAVAGEGVKFVNRDPRWARVLLVVIIAILSSRLLLRILGKLSRDLQFLITFKSEFEQLKQLLRKGSAQNAELHKALQRSIPDSAAMHAAIQNVSIRLNVMEDRHELLNPTRLSRTLLRYDAHDSRLKRIEDGIAEVIDQLRTCPVCAQPRSSETGAVPADAEDDDVSGWSEGENHSEDAQEDDRSEDAQEYGPSERTQQHNLSDGVQSYNLSEIGRKQASELEEAVAEEVVGREQVVVKPVEQQLEQDDSLRAGPMREDLVHEGSPTKDVFEANDMQHSNADGNSGVHDESEGVDSEGNQYNLEFSDISRAQPLSLTEEDKYALDVQSTQTSANNDPTTSSASRQNQEEIDSIFGSEAGNETIEQFADRKFADVSFSLSPDQYNEEHTLQDSLQRDPTEDNQHDLALEGMIPSNDGHIWQVNDPLEGDSLGDLFGGSDNDLGGAWYSEFVVDSGDSDGEGLVENASTVLDEQRHQERESQQYEQGLQDDRRTATEALEGILPVSGKDTPNGNLQGNDLTHQEAPNQGPASTAVSPAQTVNPEGLLERHSEQVDKVLQRIHDSNDYSTIDSVNERIDEIREKIKQHRIRNMDELESEHQGLDDLV